MKDENIQTKSNMVKIWPWHLGGKGVCVCVSDCSLQSLTQGPLLTPLSVSQVGSEACSGVSV